MGGALAASLSDPLPNPDPLKELLEIFVNVDRRVAFTKVFLNAVRELATRGERISLSPARVRNSIRRGARRNPGFAATGAPPSLIDGISDLLQVPRRQTAEAAATFVEGHFAKAIQMIGQLIRTETLVRLGIERALLGTSLLESMVDQVLCLGTKPSEVRQPYLGSGMHRGKDHGVALFGTATNLGEESVVVLGGPDRHRGEIYHLREGALASSAFPMVFAPRAEAQLFPGSGRPDVWFSDGGMFDNLPFFPAIELLAGLEKGRPLRVPQAWRSHLRRRHQEPDLFMVGALNVNPETAKDRNGPFESMLAIRKRASSLKENVKIRAFQNASATVDRQLGRLLAVTGRSASEPLPEEIEFLKGAVNAAVLPVFPTDLDHLNPTFAFCRTLGLDPARVELSVADGCFRTLEALRVQPGQESSAAPVAKSLRALRRASQVPGWNQKAPLPIVEERLSSLRGSDDCPFFTIDRQTLVCPFTKKLGEVGRQTFSRCRKDPTHRLSPTQQG